MKRMKRKNLGLRAANNASIVYSLLRSLLLLSLLAALAGCSGKGEETLSAAESLAPSASKELNVYIWTEYIPQEIFDSFEAETGIKSNIDMYDDEYILYSVLQSDPTKYDLVFPSGDVAYTLNSLKLLRKFDKSNMPNIENLANEYRRTVYDPAEDYFVPIDWGTTVIVYNPEIVAPEDVNNSWGLLWNSKYAGKIASLSDQTCVFATALKYMGKSLNSRDMNDLKRARELLLEQKPLLAGYMDYTEQREKLASGEVAVAAMFSGDAIVTIDRAPHLRMFLPVEGSDFYMDGVSIPIAAKNSQNAEMFINYLLRPDVYAKFILDIKYGSVNKAAENAGLLDSWRGINPAAFLNEEQLSKLEPWDPNSSATEDAAINSNSVWAELNPSESEVQP